MKESLTPRQEKFCQEIVAGNTQSEAYRGAYKPKSPKRNSIHVNASKLMAKTKIRLRVEELRKPIVQHIQADRVRVCYYFCLPAARLGTADK
jgi:phage terminase small subunit